MILTPTAKKFVMHWGEMGSRWGINRTVAQVHALLYISENPLHAEDIAQALGIARSNVSTSLRELQGWAVIKTVHQIGDRRDHFTSVSDVWELFRVILDERKRREMDPTLALLRECVKESAAQNEQHTHEQLHKLLHLFEMMDNWYANISKLPQHILMNFLQIGDKMLNMLDFKNKTTPKSPLKP